MMNINFGFSGRDNNAGYCSTPESIPGTNIDIKTEINQQVSPYYERFYSEKVVSIKKCSKGSAYLTDQCYTKPRIIEIDPNCRYFFPKTDQDLNLVANHLLQLLERKIIVLKPAPPTPPKPANDQTRDGFSLDDAFFTTSKPFLTSQATEEKLAMDLMMPVLPPLHQIDGRLLPISEGGHYRTMGYCNKCRIIATDTFSFKKLTLDEVSDIICGIATHKSILQFDKHIKESRKNINAAIDSLSDKFFTAHLSKHFRNLDTSIKDYLKLMQQVATNKQLFFDKDNHSKENKLQTQFKEAHSMASKIDIDLLKENSNQCCSTLAQMAIKRLDLFEVTNHFTEEESVSSHKALAKSYHKTLCDEFNKLPWHIVQPDNPILLFGSKILEHIYSEKGLLFLDIEKMRLIKDRGEKLTADIVLIFDEIEKLHHEIANLESSSEILQYTSVGLIE